VGLEMTLEGAEGRIWCSKIGWQTVPCSWSIDGEAALTGSNPAVDCRLLSARLAVTFSAAERHRLLADTKLHCSVTEAHVRERLAQGCCPEARRPGVEPAIASPARRSHCTPASHTFQQTQHTRSPYDVQQ